MTENQFTEESEPLEDPIDVEIAITKPADSKELRTQYIGPSEYDSIKIPIKYEVWRDGVFQRDFDLARAYYVEDKSPPRPNPGKDVPYEHQSACLVRLTHRPIWITNIGHKTEFEEFAEQVELNYTFKFNGENRQDDMKKLWIEIEKILDTKKLIDLGMFKVPVGSSNVTDLHKYLLSCYEENFRRITPKQVVWRTGYHSVNGRPAWLIGNSWIGEKSEDIIVDKERRSALMHAVERSGKREEWVDYTQDLMRDFPITRWFLACSFAAPLLRLVNMRTFVVHHYGDTKRAKSALALLAQSAWGDAEQSKLSFNATEIAMTEVFRYVSDIPIVYDELQSCKNKDRLDLTIYNWTNQRPRIRARKDGGIQKPGDAWCTLIRTTGEQSLLGLTNDMGGQSTRVLEVHDVGIDDEARSADIYRWFEEKNHGWAGVDFLSAVHGRIMKEGNTDWLVETFNQLKKALLPADGSGRSFIPRIAVIALAEYWMLRVIYKMESRQAMTLALLDGKQILANVSDRMSSEEPLWRRVVAKLIEHRTSTPQVYVDITSNNIEHERRLLQGVRGAGNTIVAYEMDREIWYVPSAVNQVLKEEFGEDFDQKRAWGDLKENKVTICTKGRLDAQRTKSDLGIRSTRFYVVSRPELVLPYEVSEGSELTREDDEGVT